MLTQPKVISPRQPEPPLSVKFPQESLVQPWTMWHNKKERRIFLIVDIPTHIADNVVLLEFKDYQQGEERIFKKIPFSDWITLTEEKKLLTPFIPKP